MAQGKSAWLWVLVGLLAAVVLLGPARILLGMLSPLVWMPWWGAGLVLVPFLLLGALVIGVGYLAYRARVARQEAPIEEMLAAGPDPVEELARLNDELEAEVAEARASLDRTRETMERGLRG